MPSMPEGHHLKLSVWKRQDFLALSVSLAILPLFTLHCGNDTNCQLNFSPWNSLNGKWCQNQITEYADRLIMPLMDMEKSPLWEVHTDSITTASKSPVTSSFSQNRALCFHRWCDAEPSLGPLIVHLSMRFQICGVLQRSQGWSHWAESAKSKTVLHAECKRSGLQKCHRRKDTSRKGNETTWLIWKAYNGRNSVYRLGD